MARAVCLLLTFFLLALIILLLVLVEMAKIKEMNPELTAPNTRMVAEMVLDTTLPTPVVRFTVLLLVGVQRLDVVLNALGFLWGIVAPLFAGAALAFVLHQQIPEAMPPERSAPGAYRCLLAVVSLQIHLLEPRAMRML